MQQWTAETKRIIENDHVTQKTYDKTVKSIGFANYVRSRGGVFSKWYGKTAAVKTVPELCERMEYVQGLMYIFRFCYWNNSAWWYFKNSTAQSFYSSKITDKGCRSGSIEQLCQGAGGRLRIINCNYGVDTALKALGVYKYACTDKAWLSKGGGQKVGKKTELRPGDIVHFYRISDGKWHHVVMVCRIEGGKVWCWDFGSRFIRTGNPLHYMAANGSTAAGGEYGSDKWAGWHIMNLSEEAEPVKTDTDRAVEMICDLRNTVQAKEKEYGETITGIAKDLTSDRAEYLRACADYVLDRHAGAGEARKVFFGSDYNDVQKVVTWVMQAAKDVVAGKYGNDEERRQALGDNWQVVQNEVNRMKQRGEF